MTIQAAAVGGARDFDFWLRDVLPEALIAHRSQTSA